MEKEILYTTAIDKDGKIIHIENAEKGNSYYCPLCKNEFILRKSGKTGKGSRRPHFAHNELSPNCTPESVLHYSFKKMLIEILEKYHSENKVLSISWICSICEKKSSGNLLENVTTIQEEYNLKMCRPDIALLDKEENVFAVIEIVVTHKPEDYVYQYYKENNITLIQINLTSEEDLNKVEEKIVNPDFVDLCLDPKCFSFKNYKSVKRLIVSTKICGICWQPVRTCHIEMKHIFGLRIIKPIDFTANEIEFAKSKGCKFKTRLNNKSKSKYYVITCLGCERNRSRYRRQRF